ncbi:hypothetical protein QBC39DRAFT_356622 [Podospora conica]|nr:hypothetical protein QBC39DRAFT_356622 [Schizothecium conicum]
MTRLQPSTPVRVPLAAMKPTAEPQDSSSPSYDYSEGRHQTPSSPTTRLAFRTRNLAKRTEPPDIKQSATKLRVVQRDDNPCARCIEQDTPCRGRLIGGRAYICEGCARQGLECTPACDLLLSAYLASRIEPEPTAESRTRLECTVGVLNGIGTLVEIGSIPSSLAEAVRAGVLPGLPPVPPQPPTIEPYPDMSWAEVWSSLDEDYYPVE